MSESGGNPTTGRNTKPTVKRKRRDGAEEISKKRPKPAREAEVDDQDDDDWQFKQLETQILDSRKHYNNIVLLVEAVEALDGNLKRAFEAAETLGRVFIRLLASGSLVQRRDSSEKELTVVMWLRERLSDYKRVLLAMFQDHQLAAKALMLAMALLKAEAQYMDDRDDHTFPKAFFRDMVHAVFRSDVEQLRDEFGENFVGEYDDIRFYTFWSIQEILSDEDRAIEEKTIENMFDFLLSMEDVPETNEDVSEFYIAPPAKKKHAIYSASQHRKQAQGAWLAFMQFGLDRAQRKRVLENMTTSVVPWFTQPELLMDFLTDSYDAGGSLSLLALSGVFYLIQHRNLDYPAFYSKLYSLLDADMMHSRHRSRFLRLLDTFLASSHLPAVMVASFIKRMARIALTAPPSAIVATVPWFYNLFKKHPLCTFMMHRVPRTREAREKLESDGMADPFLPDEADPMETHAIDSCLWEIVQLQSHYHPNVATIAKIISEQFTKQMYNMEDFLDHSYGSLLAAELSKEVRKPPVVEYMIPKHIFTRAKPGAEDKDSLLVSLWDFGS